MASRTSGGGRRRRSDILGGTVGAVLLGSTILGAPDRGDIRSLALGGTKLGEELMRLSVERGLLLLLLASSGRAHGGGPGARSVVGRLGEVDIRNLLDGNGVGTVFSMLLHELLSGRELARG